MTYSLLPLGDNTFCLFSRGIKAEDLWSKSVLSKKNTMQVTYVILEFSADLFIRGKGARRIT